MKMNHVILFAMSSVLILLLQSCSITSHPVGKAAIGKTSSSAEMERLIEQPGPIEFKNWGQPLAVPCQQGERK
jgi:hypothetical protein